MISIFSWNYVADAQQPGWIKPPTLAKLLDFDKPVTLYHSIDQYCDSQADVKIAFYEVQYGRSRTQELETIGLLSRSSDIVFLFHSEVYDYNFVANDTELFDNAHWIIPGACRDSKQKIITWQYHVWRMAELYQKKLKHRLTDLAPGKQKEYFFSALLGNSKPHRHFVNQQVLDNNLQNKIICKILPEGLNRHANPVQLDQSPNFLTEPDLEVFPDTLFVQSGDHCQYHGIKLPVSCIVPVTAYNTCAYSILAETGYTNHCHMPTEKSAKLFLGQQLFVAFSGAGYLQHLRDSGFQTFSNIIDESYDQIEDNYERWSRAFDQVIDLCNIDQLEVLEQARPILQHNFNHANGIGIADLLSKIQQALLEKEINCTIPSLIINQYPE